MPSEAGARNERRGTQENLDPRPAFLDPHLGVLVTRPAPQAGGLIRLIEQAGGRAILWPVLEIVPEHSSALDDLPERVARADVVIFISPNAVEQFAQRGVKLTDAALVGAVGEGTASALRHHLSREPDLRPSERFDSEALLAQPALHQVSAKTILIVRGAGGRELLAETLRSRGAKVEYAEVYRRVCPAQVPPDARQALARGDVDIVIVTSGEGLHNLLRMAGNLADRLRGLPLIVVSHRLAASATDLGFEKTPLVARGASDEALIDALRAWATRERGSA